MIVVEQTDKLVPPQSLWGTCSLLSSSVPAGWSSNIQKLFSDQLQTSKTKTSLLVVFCHINIGVIIINITIFLIYLSNAMTATPLSVMTRRTMPTVVRTEVEMYSWDIMVKVNMLTTTCCENFCQGSGSYYLSVEHEEGKYVSNQPRHLKYITIYSRALFSRYHNHT